MPSRPDTDDYRALFLHQVPMMDMRAPVEFQQGAFPNAYSLPLMSDEQRAEVGTCYKRSGQAAAIALGHRLVSGELKDQQIERWLAFAHEHPQGYLYCFRGGLRSQTVQQWLRKAGVDYPLVKGGYKAMRRFLIENLEAAVEQAELVLVSGKTGTGKTRVIQRLARSIDLEGLAHHRGSSFGQLPEGQPSQIDFENTISIAFLQLLHADAGRVYLEDEGRLIGRLSLPEPLRKKMALAPMVMVEQTLEQRVDVVIEDYVIDLGQRYVHLYAEQGPRLHAEKLQADLARIRKRLGGLRFQTVSEQMNAAFEVQHDTGKLDLHRDWISTLLAEYYDPMYEYQLSQRDGERWFSGDRDTVISWAEQQPGAVQ